MTSVDEVLPRLFRFHVVGLIGACVQVMTLAMLTRVVGVHYLIATAMAVETAVLHNFIWHEQWTWGSKTCISRISSSGAMTARLKRLLRFNLINGSCSIVTNVIVTRFFVEMFHAPYLLANVIAIAIGSIATYLAADLYVFRTGEKF